MTDTPDANKGDEWDLVPSEEELLDQISQLKKELASCNECIVDLESRNSSLETERSGTSTELKLSKTELAVIQAMLNKCVLAKENIEKELHIFQGTSEAQLMSMEEALSNIRDQLDESRDTIKNLECELKDAQQLHSKEKQKAANSANEAAELSRNLLEVQASSKLQGEAIVKLEKQLKIARSDLEATRDELSEVRKVSEAQGKELEIANMSLGSVAVLAEDRNHKRASLDRTVAEHKQALATVSKDKQQLTEKVASLVVELTHLRTTSSARIQELEESVDDLEKVLEEALDKDNELKMKIRDLLKAKDRVYELETANSDLKSREALLEEKLKESKSAEEKLQHKIQEVQFAHELRLDEIREALGIKTKLEKQVEEKPMNPLDFIIQVFTTQPFFP
eukprot:CAMPEP_0194202270 /NCGR_PEP_ID=MMETSP0156-20130528/2332_1 /TAXON_ID=33649 /ORGANISM="Thalassionema nitzschioides, Strain L26-B" /LENGTH=395 /DNA_ID=CAMNT_0038927717 /DNA_START=41 /DNA_END=1228 /DNA_ORIENTATION=-